jgi:hypothetical protein
MAANDKCVIDAVLSRREGGRLKVDLIAFGPDIIDLA